MKSNIKFKKFNDLNPEDINIDFHMHTSQTDGESTPEEMIDQAKKLNLKAVAFTEHVNYSTNWFHDFKNKLENLRKKEKMQIFIGIEVKPINFQGTLDTYKDIIENAELVVGSVHRYPDGKGGLLSLDEIKNLKQEKAAEIEFNATRGLLKNNKVNIIGHPFGVYSKFFNKFPEEYMEKLLKESLKRKIAIEINTHYNLDKLQEYFKLFKKINPYVSIGSDAHNKDEIARKFNLIKKELK